MTFPVLRVVLLIQSDVVVARDDYLELGWNVLEHFDPSSYVGTALRYWLSHHNGAEYLT